MDTSLLPILLIEDSDEALEYLHQTGRYIDPQNAPRPALILLDLNLPGTDGREILAQIKRDEHFYSIPLIVMTTSSHPRDVLECYCRGRTVIRSRRRTIMASSRECSVWLSIGSRPSRSRKQVD